jgi:hypothetical protein
MIAGPPPSDSQSVTRQATTGVMLRKTRLDSVA